MMRLEPTLIVNRLRIERGAQVAYDECFHSGVNIIRGENSSGKSTILNFLFYGLGGDLSEWSETARLCTRVNVEVSLNGKLATLSREVSSEPMQPMDVFGGSLDDALIAPRSEWNRYPYRRSTNTESYSQVLFRLLNMPEAGNDTSGNITFHQVLRLLYADQLSPVEHLFKFERFDPPSKRDAVGRLLCGAYDNQMYQNELQIRELSKELDGVTSELRSLFSVLGRTQESMTLDWIVASRKVLLERKASLVGEIEVAERNAFSAAESDQLSLAAQEQAYTAVKEAQIRIGELEERLDALSLAIADSMSFISALESKLEALGDANAVAQYLGDVEFQSCPACLAPIESKQTEHSCHLCKAPFDKDRVRQRIVSLINDTAIQLKQSKTLQERRLTQLNSLQSELNAARDRWRLASARLQEVRRTPSSEIQDSLRVLHRQSGYLDREIEDLENKVAIAQLIDDLTRKKADLNSRISKLRDDIEARVAEQSKRLARAYTTISAEVIRLIKSDLRRQDSFENAREVQFDFGANSITVDGISYFSASSRAVLKSSFFIGFLAAALQLSFFRHPRFVILDTIEDKGMEAVRSQNFQRLLVSHSDATTVEHQIIFATAMIDPGLDDPKYTVGEASTRDRPTLNIGIKG